MSDGPQHPTPAKSPEAPPAPAWLEALAAALAESLLRLYDTDVDVALGALIKALTEALAAGAVSLDLQGPMPEGLDPDLWPGGYRQRLLQHPLSQRDDGPLVLVEDRLSWRRWHRLRQDVIEALVHRARAPLALPVAAEEGQRAVSAAAAAGLDPRQQQAVLALLQGPLVLLEGGPGTGKTSTVVQMLAALLRWQPEARVHLAAPTGKAAARLRQAIQAGAQRLEPALSEHLAGLSCTTLHRLLESRGERFGRDRSRPLPLDLLVVDEMSMVDLPLMAALLEALPDGCRLVLAGDAAQLPPVGPGAVLQELQRRHLDLGSAAISLTTTYRNQGAIAAVAQQLRQLQEGEDPLAGLGLDRLDPAANLEWQQASVRALPSMVRDTLRERADQLARSAQDLGRQLDAADPAGLGPLLTGDLAAGLLAAQEHLAVLTPVRQGRWGVDAINRALLGPALEQGPEAWPAGTPVLCERNRSDLELANGDLGVMLVLAAGRQVLFAGVGAAPPRLIPAALLGDVRPAHALTIHKAQGSEMDTVIVLLPAGLREERRLLYTALTRARRRAVLITPAP